MINVSEIKGSVLKNDVDDKVMFVPEYNYLGSDRKIVEILISLRYQCAEYIACDTDLYSELDSFIGKVCENLIVEDI